MACGISVRSALGFALVCLVAACSNDFGQFDFSGVPSTDASTGVDARSSGGQSAGGAGGGITGGAAGGDGGAGAPGSGGAGGVGDASIASGGTGGMAGSATGGTDDGSAGAADTGTVSDADEGDGTLGMDALADGPGGRRDAADPCDARYGAAPGYVACGSTPTTCTFSARTNGSNCEALCASLAGTCIDANDNGMAPCVPTTTMDDCQTSRMTTICTCSSP